MQKLTLINTLKSFSPKEIREFGEFVHSPFFNKNQAAMKLYDHLKKYYPDFTSNKLYKETVYRESFGKTEFSESFMKTIIHILTELSEKFLFQLNLNNKPALEKLMICDELNKRKLEKQLFKLLKETEKEIEKTKNDNESKHHYYMYLFNTIKLEYTAWTHFKNKNLLDHKKEELQSIIDSLTYYYLEKLLSVHRAVVGWRKSHPLEFQDNLGENIIEFLQNNENDYIKSPNLGIHLYELLLLKNGEADYFYKLKDMLFVKTDKIEHDKKWSLITILQQYVTDKGTRGEKGFIEHKFEIYKLALEKNFYKLKSHLYFDPLLFGNIAQTAITLKDFDWTENFISKYKHELPPDNNGVVLTYTTARLEFAKGEFKKSLDLLNSIKSIVHTPYKIIIRNLMLMIYYELSYFEQAEYLVESCKKFINSSKESISEDRVKRQQNFYKYYSKLLHFNFHDKKGVENMITELNSGIILIERKWLLKKTEKLLLKSDK